MTPRLPIKLIAAVGRRGQLGLDGKLPWHNPQDLAWFKSLTMGGLVVFGAATLAAEPKLERLPGRIVLKDDSNVDPLELYDRWAVITPYRGDSDAIWIAGGARTYARWLPHVTQCYVSRIDYDGPADVWMPQLWTAPNPPV